MLIRSGIFPIVVLAGIQRIPQIKTKNSNIIFFVNILLFQYYVHIPPKSCKSISASITLFSQIEVLLVIDSSEFFKQHGIFLGNGFCKPAAFLG